MKSFWGNEPKILKHGSGRRQFRVNQLVGLTFIANPENKPEVNHLHGRFNNYVGSLEWATGSENEQHAAKAGLIQAPQGADSSVSKLTNAQALYIRENPDKLSQRALGNLFSVTQTTISRILKETT